MVFSSPAFLFMFLPIAIAIYYNPFCKSRIFRNRFLLFISLVFYACGEPIYILLLLFSILAGWLAARAIGSSLDPKFRKKILIADVSFHVLLLFVFKYLTFTITQLGLLLHTSLINLQIALPLGISFFTFQILSYVFDIYYQKVPVQKNFFDIALYVALFPQLVAGPIVRYSSIMNEIRTRSESWDLFSDGMLRFIYGLAKKVLIANYMAQVADNIFDYGTPVPWPLPGWEPLPTLCRFISISPDIPIWPSALASCSDSIFRKTSIIPTFLKAPQNSGAVGI